MKYTCEVEINAPLDKVVTLWQDEGSFSQWQDGFQHIDRISGESGAEGSKSKIFLKAGKREMELLETVLVSNLPNEKKGLYEHSHMTNTQSSRFEKIGDDRTRYVSEVEYTQFNGFMPKLMAKLMPSMFKKQSQKWMDQFKRFAESQ